MELTRSGPFFFISGHDQRCENSQKLTDVVLSDHHAPSSTAPSLSPSAKTPSHAPPLHPPSHSPSPAAQKDSLPLPHSPSPITPAHAPPPSNYSPSPSPTAQTQTHAPPTQMPAPAPV
ncbi:extensin-like [Salvia splendens]|uniref:extensin-like n=1 Tax=Salvia splendens TaxID=180675 RepID=UPI001C268EE6|nr:extensin-like [Salvia splendens]